MWQLDVFDEYFVFGESIVWMMGNNYQLTEAILEMNREHNIELWFVDRVVISIRVESVAWRDPESLVMFFFNSIKIYL